MGERSLLGIGLYSVADASRYAEMPRGVVSAWAELLTEDERLELATPHTVLTFEDLITLLVVRDLHRAGVRISDIKKAEMFLARKWGVQKPFATARIRTGYGMVVTALRAGERPVAVTDAAQEIFFELVRKDLRVVSYGARKRAAQWSPQEHVLVRPDIQFGKPCIAGTRITTEAVAGMLAAGDDAGSLADDFGISTEKVKAAWRWEERIGRAA